MSRFTTLLLTLVFAGKITAQPIPSSCTAPDSVVAKYSEDAAFMAIRKLFRNNLPDTALVKIPQSHTDTILKALLAVYNAVSISARDTVVDIIPIHNHLLFSVRDVSITADSSLGWMKELKLGNQPTGNHQIDSLFTEYGLSLNGYSSFNDLFDWHLVHFKSDSIYNMFALGNVLMHVPGIYSADPTGIVGDGDYITDSIYPQFVELVYSYGWEDCQLGCIYRRYWTFRVYYDCSVEYIGSHGHLLPVKVATTQPMRLSTSPNPFSSSIIINGLQENCNYILTNLLGQTVSSGVTDFNQISNIGYLDSGLYLLTLYHSSNKPLQTFKVFKH